MNIRKLSSLDYISGLDGIRAIAVLLVILHHYLLPFSTYISQSILGKLAIIMAKIGWVGVDIFFVISGYLITQILIKRPVKTFQDYKLFITARAWRLLPAYIGCLLFFTAIAVWLNPNSKVLNNSISLWTLTSNMQSAFLDRTALMDNQFNLVHFWSLALEWHFYLSIPLLLWLFRAYWALAIFLFVIALTTRVAFQKTGLSDNAIYAFTFCRLDAFAMGIILSVCLPQIKHQFIPYLGALGLTFFILTLFMIAVNPIPFKKVAWLQSYGYSLIAGSFASALCPIITGQAKGVLHILESKALVAIGRRSYSLYIWHLVFFPLIIQIVISLKLQPYLSVILVLLIASLISILFSTISYQFIETKCYQSFKQSTNEAG